MRMGVSAKRVWAIPVEVYCVASKEALTPTKGPKMVEATAHHTAFRSRAAWRSCSFQPLLKRHNANRKPTKPMYVRMSVAAKGTVTYEGKVVIGKCDTDENNDIAMQFGVRNIPMLVFLKNGEVVETLVGLQRKNDLVKLIDSLI